MNRGEVWWANLQEPIGHRPVVLLSREESYAVRDMIIVTPVTSRSRNLPTEVRLGLEDGMPRSCVANLDVIMMASRSELEERITTLSPAKMRGIEDALHFALGLAR